MVWHGLGSRSWRHTTDRTKTAHGFANGTAARGNIVADVVADLDAGLTVRQIAANRHLPVDFVDMAITRARERGLLQVTDLSPRSMCGETTCQPDPSSLICAGCPFRPRADGRAAPRR